MHQSSTQPLEQIKYMDNEVASEFLFDQSLYYPAAANYYGYYCTGFDSPGEWNDHHGFFGVDGQELHYLGLQTESLPYVSYTPSYGYAQSPYNPYNPYIPGAAIGLDSMPVGTQQYLTSPSYQHVPTTYFPVVVQSSSDILPISSSDSSLLGTGAPVVNRSKTAAVNYIPSGSLLPSANGAATSQRVVSGNSKSEPSHSSTHQINSMLELSGGLLVNMVADKQPSSQGPVTPGSVSQVAQGRIYSGVTELTDHFTYGRNYSVQNPLKVTVPANNRFTSFGSHAHRWATVDKFRPGFQHNGALNNVNGSPDVLGEQNRGPRRNMSKGPWTSTIDVQAYTTKAGAISSQGNIIVCVDQYNQDNFPLDYPEAKFFVIKSYSEDDVHRSIKYNVWSSTLNGNKRLDSAYEEAQRMSIGKPRKCPVFLFFSVNASGQFCGVAEMNGPVDFNKDMDFWQQDKWTGSFPVKWHIVKDVPNTSFRHIVLENNENKPATNSRDTQEITYLPGMNMLSIFKNSPLRTSILDDFMYYEEQQRIMYEEKCRLLERHCNNVLFPSVSPSKIQEQLPISDGEAVNSSIEQPLNTIKEQLTGTSECQQVLVDLHPQYVGKQPNIKTDHTVKADGGHLSGKVDQPWKKANGKHSNVIDYQSLKEDEKQTYLKADLPSHKDGMQPVHEVKKPSKADIKQVNSTVNKPCEADRGQPEALVGQPPEICGNTMKPSDLKTSVKVGSNDMQVRQRLDATNSSTLPRPDRVKLSNGASSFVKIGSVSIDAKKGDANCAEAFLVDVVTVGSVHIKVKKSDVSSGILTIGSIPIDPKGVKPQKS